MSEGVLLLYVDAKSVETCMMDVGPHHECSGTMAETRAVVEWRHLDARRDIHTPRL